MTQHDPSRRTAHGEGGGGLPIGHRLAAPFQTTASPEDCPVISALAQEHLPDPQPQSFA